MTDRPQLTIICYDIVADKARAKVAAYLETLAVRVQKSVFETRLNLAQREKILRTLDAYVGLEDSIRMYVVSNDGIEACRVIGCGVPPSTGSFLLY